MISNENTEHSEKTERELLEEILEKYKDSIRVVLEAERIADGP